MKMIKNAFIGATLLAASTASADVLWHDESLTLLWGGGFEVDPDEQLTMTFESAGGATWGDWFIFYDYTDYVSGNVDTDGIYGEISPRLSFNKLFDAGISAGPLSDISLAFTYENGRGNVESILYGLGFDWALPYASYFQTNVYYRNANNNDSDGWQLTPVFRFDIPVGTSNIVIDGYIDWVFKSDNSNYDTNVHVNPQIKYDLGMALNGKNNANKLMVGIEYDYWKNKYGIENSSFFDTDQSAISAIIKYHF